MTQPLAQLTGPLDWPHYLAALLLVLVRVSSLAVIAPVFSSGSVPREVKVLFVLIVSLVLAPVAAALPMAHAQISVLSILGELAVGLVFGLTLSMVSEIALFAGTIFGLQFSFSLVNLLDPNTSIETPLFGQLFSLFLTTLLLVSGLDRTMIAALVRTFATVPVGAAVMNARVALSFVTMLSGVLLAALQLSAPVLAASLLVEISVALVGRLSPSLPVMNMTIPAKTLVGYVVLLGSLAVWPHFLEARFSSLLDVAQELVMHLAQNPVVLR